MWLDATSDNDLTTAVGWLYNEYKGSTSGPKVAGSVVCSSMGPDGQWGTKSNYALKGSDDVVTW